MPRTFFVTRPTLANSLMDAGFKGERTVNPYDESRPAWKFPLSQSLALEISRYYRSIEKPVPVTISKFLQVTSPTVAEAENLL